MRLSFTKFLFSILLVGLGIILLLVNTHLITAGINAMIITYYPVVLILIGLWFIFSPLLQHRRIHWFWGLFFLALGGLLGADRLGLTTFHLSMFWKLWPLLLVYIGIKALTKGRRHSHHYNKSLSKHKEKKSSFFRVVTCLHMNEPNWLVEPMDFWYMVGEYHFDFSPAFIPDEETPIHLGGFVGDVKILIPEDLPFCIEGYASVGDLKIAGLKQDGIGKSIAYKTADYDEAKRKIKFNVDFKVLDLRIDRV